MQFHVLTSLIFTGQVTIVNLDIFIESLWTGMNLQVKLNIMYLKDFHVYSIIEAITLTIKNS